MEGKHPPVPGRRGLWWGPYSSFSSAKDAWNHTIVCGGSSRADLGNAGILRTIGTANPPLLADRQDQHLDWWQQNCNHLPSTNVHLINIDCGKIATNYDPPKTTIDQYWLVANENQPESHTIFAVWFTIGCQRNGAEVITEAGVAQRLSCSSGYSHFPSSHTFSGNSPVWFNNTV